MKSKKFTVAPLKMAQLALSEINPDLRMLLSQEKKFVSTKKGNGDTFYYGNVFDEILEKKDKGIGGYGYYLSPEVLADLKQLSKLCKNYIYVQILAD